MLSFIFVIFPCPFLLSSLPALLSHFSPSLFSMVFLCSCQFLVKECTVLVNRLEDWVCLVNVWLGKLTALDMNPLDWQGHKILTQTILPFPGRQHKMIHKDWPVIKTQHNQSNIGMPWWLMPTTGNAVHFRNTGNINPHPLFKMDLSLQTVHSRKVGNITPLSKGASLCRPRWLSWMRRPTGDQEVATSFRGDWPWNIFYGHSLPSAASRRAVVSFWR